jgi:hypothetical protein
MTIHREDRPDVADIDIDTLGPVDFLIVEFPEGTKTLTGEGLDELRRLVESGQIKVLDMLFLAKNADGSVEASELSDLVDVDELRFLEAELATVLAEEDVENLAAAMLPGAFAAVLVYENLWAAPFASAVRRAGGQLVANGRIPIQAIIASMEAAVDEIEGE